MREGKLPHADCYSIDEHVTDDEINAAYQGGRGMETTPHLITPTEQQMMQAEAEVKRTIEEALPTDLSFKKRKTFQF